MSWVEGGRLQLHRVRCVLVGGLMCGHQGCCSSDMVGLDRLKIIWFHSQNDSSLRAALFLSR